MRCLRIRVALGAAACVSILPHPLDALAGASFTAVNWSLVSPTAIAAAQKALVAPIGCACVQTSGATCPFFDCSCTCDLTAGACDAFCCCDTECSVDHIAAVKSQDLCVEEEFIKPSIEYCSTDLTLKSVASTGVNPLLADSVLCVAVDNNEVVGNYISTPEEQSMAAANAFLQNPKQYSFSSSDSGASSASSPSTRTTYLPGDSIPVFANPSSASTHSPYLMGWAAIAGSTRCSQRNPVRFDFDWPESDCVLDGIVLDDVCEANGGVLDAAAVAESLYIAAKPNVVLEDATISDVISMDVELLELDFDTGLASSLETPFPSYYPHPQLASDNVTTTCSGALLRAAYTVYHNGNGSISRVSAALTIGSLSSATNASLAVAQLFSVRFVSTAAISRSLTQGNVQTYARSGNPGYLLHLPVRVGVVTTSTNDSLADTQVISEMNGGLALPGLGDCSSSGSALLLATPVLFGEDARLSCTLSLNASSFESFCERVSPVVPDALRVPFSHVARFGNADPFLLDEWLAIDYDAPAKSSAAFTDAAGAGAMQLQCSGVLTSLHLEFLVAAVGPANNPQSKIVAARATHAKDTWTFWRNVQDEIFLLTTTVSFVYVEATRLDQWIPPTPPIWFSIPSDVFYPFLLSGGARAAPAASPWTLLLLWGACAWATASVE